MKQLKMIDWIIIVGTVVALIVGFLTYKHFRQTASKQIEATSKIGFQVFFRGVTLTGNKAPIKANDKTFITIRNIPYTELQVVDVKIDSKKTILPNVKSTKEPFTLVEDISQAFLYDMIVTLVDTAKITKDGAVVGGNKMKIGLPVTLEGPDYKLNGTVSDVQILTDIEKPTAKDAAITKQDKNMG